MELSFNALTSAARDVAMWAHNNAKTVPFAGHYYTLFVDNVGVPVADKINQHITPILSPLWEKVKAKAEQHPTAFKVGGVITAAIVLKAIYAQMTSSDPTKPKN